MTAQVNNESFLAISRKYSLLHGRAVQKRRNLLKPRLLWETSKKYLFILGNA